MMVDEEKKSQSQKAMDDCKKWITAACMSPMVDGALDCVLEPLRDKFHQRLDGDDGPRTWEGDTPRMQDNARYMGVLAEFFAKGEPAVTQKHLEVALEMVAVKCMVGKPPGVHGFWFYCNGGGLQSPSTRNQTAVALIESVRSRTS